MGQKVNPHGLRVGESTSTTTIPIRMSGSLESMKGMMLS